MIDNKDLPAMPLSKEMNDSFEEGYVNLGNGFTKYERTVIALLKGILSYDVGIRFDKNEAIDLAIEYADLLFEKLDKRQ